jgi:glycosyltransferase involved in cell wall biosynthesis
MIRSLDVLTHIDPRYGGMSVAVAGLSRATAGTGRCAAKLAAVCDAGERSDLARQNGFQFVRIPFDGPRPLADVRMKRRLREVVRASDVVHIHGIWDAHSLAVGSLAREYGKPVIASAHGMLETWALNDKHWKKTVYAGLFERPNLRRSHCLRALTRTEASNYRSFGLASPIALIPNGVDAPESISPQLFLERFPHLAGKCLMLFLGRIHYKKGVDLLCRAWAKLCGRYPGTHLVLAGPDFEGTRASVEALIQDLGISGSVSFTGMLEGDLKWSALAACAVFVLPSHSEALSVAVLEAMAAGRPVIITRQCNFPEVARAGGGWIIEPDAGQIEAAMEEFLSLPESSAAAVGAQGQRLVRERHNWGVIGRQMVEVYEWVLGGSKPTSVEFLL